MMHGGGKSDPGIVAVKPANNAEQSAAESVEPRTGTKGNEHTPGTGLGKGVTGVGPHTTSCKAKEEGAVHLAPPPRQHRSAPVLVLRIKEGCGTRGRRPSVAGLRDTPRGQPRGFARSGPPGSVPGAAQSSAIHTKGRWPAAADCGVCSGRQNRPESDRRGAERDLRGRFPRIFVRVPAQAQPARCAGCAGGWNHHHQVNLVTQGENPKLLKSAAKWPPGYEGCAKRSDW